MARFQIIHCTPRRYYNGVAAAIPSQTKRMSTMCEPRLPKVIIMYSASQSYYY